MDRVLAVVGRDEASTDLLREAGSLAAGADAELLLLGIQSEDAVASDLETLERIGEVENSSYGPEVLSEAVVVSVREVADAELSDIDVEYSIVSAIAADDEEATEILSVADRRDCDHVFLTGRRRSPTGKALFGDTAQKVLLNFDGYVTVSLE